MIIDERKENLFSKMTLHKGATKENIEDAEKNLGIKFPNDYIDFVLFSDGAEGEIGNDYLEIWSVEELLQSNEDMQLNLFVPGLVAFGGDGGNELFAFDTRFERITIVQIPMVGMTLKDAWACGSSFEEFLILKSEG